MPFRSLLANTTTKGKVVMAASALAVLAVMLVMFKVASAPSYTTMLTGLDPAETGKITAALDSIQQDAATASQQLATGQATDPSSTVMTIERARLSMQLASQIRTKGVEALQEVFRTSV